jgi:putative transposase
VLNDIASFVTPDTIMAWHRKLIAMNWNHLHKRGPGRPRIMSDIASLIVRMATENGTWGYTRIQGALSNLSSMWLAVLLQTILKEHGIDPAPLRGRRTSWDTFLKAHLTR